MVEIKKDYIQVNFEELSKMRDILSDLHSNGLDLIHNGKENYWLIVNHDESYRYIIEEDYRGISDLALLANKDLTFILEK